jgi:phosphoglucomutase
VAISALAGKPATKEMLVDLAWLERDYYEHKPEVGNPAERVRSFPRGRLSSATLHNFHARQFVVRPDGNGPASIVEVAARP